MYVFTCRIHFAQFAREIRIDVSVPLSLGIVVTCLGLLCVGVCVRKTETEVLSVGSSTYELVTETGRGRGQWWLWAERY